MSSRVGGHGIMPHLTRHHDAKPPLRASMQATAQRRRLAVGQQRLRQPLLRAAWLPAEAFEDVYP